MSTQSDAALHDRSGNGNNVKIPAGLGFRPNRGTLDTKQRPFPEQALLRNYPQ